MYRQVYGVAMGSALGVTFANYYMAHIENTVISDLTVKPKLYARYVDDCFLVVEDEEHLEHIRREFQNKSVLKFTKEVSVNNRLNFLDVAIDSNGETYVTSVYRKETNKGHFMNARGECPERYKVGMIRGLIDRTHKISSSIEIFNVECKKLKQLLINRLTATVTLYLTASLRNMYSKNNPNHRKLPIKHMTFSIVIRWQVATKLMKKSWRI